MIELYPCFSHLGKFNNIFVIGDPHFADEETTKLRANNVSDEELVRRINSKVGKKDVLIILGDVGDVEYVKKLRGYKILIMGNHDKGASNYRKSKLKSCPECGSLNLTQDSSDRLNHCYTCGDCHGRFDDDYFKVVSNHLFDEVYTGMVMLNDKILLSHEPVSLPFAFNIHGHVHSMQAKDDKLHMNVCAEHVNYTPVSLIDLQKRGAFSAVQSIHRITIDKATERKSKRSGNEK